MLTKQLSLVLCLAFVFMVKAQKSESEKLLIQAEEIAFYNPKEAKNIAEHTLKLSDNKEESFYISALSLYVMGKYDESLSDAFEAKAISEKNDNSIIQEKSLDIINRIFNLLQLSAYNSSGKLNARNPDKGMVASNYLIQGYSYLAENNIDSANYYLNESKSFLDFKNLGYPEMLYYGLNGDLKFKNKELESALENYKKAAEINENIENAFLSERIYTRLAAGYLALDSLAQFQQSREWVKHVSNETSHIENRASNQAYSLVIKEQDQEYTEKKSRFQWIFGGISLLLLISLFVKVIFYIRNKNKLKMLNQMQSYLKSQEKKEEIIPERVEPLPVIEEVQEKTINKTTSLLKESEQQLLAGLEKFETTKKFTNKDMSLSKLASQLGTNTKYLSEVINRHKLKNFNTYINELRIHYITEKIKSDPTYLNYKVSYLAEECGFSSHSSFTTVFKTIVGVSPSTFVEFVREEQNEKSDSA